jgi:hypothetical protein
LQNLHDGQKKQLIDAAIKIFAKLVIKKNNNKYQPLKQIEFLHSSYASRVEENLSTLR